MDTNEQLRIRNSFVRNDCCSGMPFGSSACVPTQPGYSVRDFFPFNCTALPGFSSVEIYNI